MSRSVNEVLRSGYLTSAEKLAMDFENALEAAEEEMGEAAAMAVTCEMAGVEVDDAAALLVELPDGEWWKAQHLPVRSEES